MSEFIWFYLYTVLTSLEVALVLIVVLVLSGIGLYMFAVSLAASCGHGEVDINAAIAGLPKKSVLTLLISTVILSVSVPSKKELAFIVGGGSALHLAQVEGVSELPKNLIQSINSFLKSTGSEVVAVIPEGESEDD